jgi:tetratricopeptide (TPR) repeat protein
MTTVSAGDLREAGLRLLTEGRFPEAIAVYIQALNAEPGHPDALCNLGVALAEQGRHADAESCYVAALRSRPNFPTAAFNRGNSLRALGRLSEAVDAYRQALTLQPSFTPALTNLGLALADLGNLAEAAEMHARVIQQKPDLAEAHNNRGLMLWLLGRHAEAEACYNEAVKLKPDFPAAHCNRALLWLQAGTWRRGWAEYEWRLRLPNQNLPPRRLPLWNGESLNGRTLLVRTEQGLGDTIQFIRYATQIRLRGGRVLLECPAKLHRLLSGCADVGGFVTRDDPAPDAVTQIPLLSLPRVFDTSIAKIPNPSAYLSAEPERIARWRKRFPVEEKLRIGIAWQGSPTYVHDRQRSIPLSAFAVLAKVPNVRLYSLQKGPGSEQASQAGFPLIDLGPNLDANADAFIDTAAAMHHLDLVVSADTALAHLAGAMGRPIWLLLSAAADWRWLREGADTPWYPSMRLWRQTQLGDWEQLLQRVADAVHTLGCR